MPHDLIHKARHNRLYFVIVQLGGDFEDFFEKTF
jgi:hypothetical protein